MSQIKWAYNSISMAKISHHLNFIKRVRKQALLRLTTANCNKIWCASSSDLAKPSQDKMGY